MVKKITLYILVLIFMAVATIVDKSQGTDYVHAHYYGAWWFILIWAALAALGVFYILKRKVRTASTLALHLSFVIILAGALLTHLSAKRGMTHLRINNAFPIATILFMVNLTLGFIALFYTIYRMTKKRELQALSRVFLYPALTTMGFGIFIGAIWANVSWGNYWSWDNKETWALTTFMIYAVVVHTHSLPIFRKPLAYHIYITLAFLSIVMTYFGVNYFLTGMHSYA